MADPVVPPQAAPVSSPNAPAIPPVAESVQRFNSTEAASPPEENSKSFRSFDEAFEKHFKNKIKSTPEEAQEASKSKGKDEPKSEEPKAEKKSESKEIESKQSKTVDPDTIKPTKELKGKESTDGWNHLRENSKRIYAENEKLASKVKDLEAVVASKGGMSQKEIETLKSQVEELRPYREMVDIQHDPDFRKSYDEPIETSKKAIHKILKDLQTPEETIALIDFNNPSQVDKVVQVMEEAGQKTLARRVLAHADEIQKLSEKRGEALGNAKAKFSEFSKTREQTTLAKRTEEEAVINQTVQNAYQTKDKDGNMEIPFFTMREMPANATKDQMAEVENHNRIAEALQSNVQQTLAANGPEDRALTAVRAVVGAVRDAQLKGALGKIAELEAELKRISSAGSEKRNVSSAKSSNGDPTAMRTVEASMDNFFASRRR